MSFKLRKRGPSKVKGDYKMKELYDSYLDFMGKPLESKFGEPNRTIVSSKIFRSVLKDYFQEWIRLILYENERFKIPFNMGEIYIKKKKMNLTNLIKYQKLQVDFGIFQKTGKKVYFLNEHRNGFKYHIKWDKKVTGKRVIGHFPYMIKPIRPWSRELAKILKYYPEIDYFE